MGMMPEQVAIRRNILEALFKAGGGHYGGALSVTDILFVLYKQIVLATMNKREARDRVILSKGHAAIALYAVLQHFGILKDIDLASYGQCGGLEGHPDMQRTTGVDFSTGSLGQGVGVGFGMALALRSYGAHVWVVMGDGECQEGAIWEAAMLAKRYDVTNLHVVIDVNGAQEFGWSYNSELSQSPLPAGAEKWRAFGWQIDEVDGHDCLALQRACKKIRLSGVGPSAILAYTRKGCGIALAEMNPDRYHCTTLNETEHNAFMESLNAEIG